MSYANAIRDIPTGSRWHDLAGELAIVRTAAQRFVLFSNARGQLQTPLHEDAFRNRFEPIYSKLMTSDERRHFKRQFGMTLANLSEARIYWSASERRILARSPGAVKQHTLPADAGLVGAYSHPFDLDTFLDDLDDHIAKILAASIAR